MPWRRVWFKNNKAYARADEKGELRITRGRVELVYKLGDTTRYQPALANVTPVEGEPLLPDPAPAETPEEAPAAAPAGPKPERTPKAPRPTPQGKTIIVYTDGACSGNPGEAGAGVVLISGAHRLEMGRYLGKATNNIAELTAIKVALLAMKDPRRPIELHADSAYAIGVLTRGWKAKKNPELVEEIKSLMARFAQLKIIKVEGHAGVSENERADELARQAVRERKSIDDRYHHGVRLP